MNKPTATPSAMQHFTYRYPPFADTVELNNPWQSPEEVLIVQRIITLLRQGKSLAVHGEAGTGKSMMLKTVLSQLDPKEFRVALIPYGGIKPSAILRDLCDEFDIDTTGRKGLLSRLAADFKRCAGKPFPVIVIDEAHEMQRQSFLDLCALLHDSRTRTAAAAMVLVGQPMLRRTLELDIYAPVKTRLTCSFPMPRLSIDDAHAFVDFRLETAHADKSIFDHEAVQLLATDAAGNRRTLCNMAALCLEEAARRNDRVVTAEIVTEVSLQCQL